MIKVNPWNKFSEKKPAPNTLCLVFNYSLLEDYTVALFKKDHFYSLDYDPRERPHGLVPDASDNSDIFWIEVPERPIHYEK